MATATRPFPDGTTLADYGRDGRWDCGHAYDGYLFEKAIEDNPDATPEQIFDRSWSDDGYEDWIAQADLTGHPLAKAAYDEWKAGWRACALEHIQRDIDRHKERLKEDLELYYLYAGDDSHYTAQVTEEVVETFSDLDTAMSQLARVPVGRIAFGDGNGPLYTLITVRGESMIPGNNLRRDELNEVKATMRKYRKDRNWYVEHNYQRRNPAVNRNPAMNPSWIARTLAQTFETMEHGIPAKWMPRQDVLRSRGSTLISKVNEYGCGAYGCALPTLDPDIVLKVTTDDTEAQFAEELAKTLVAPICVKYEAVLKPNMTHQGRAITLLWREEAKDIGKLAGKSEDLVSDQHRAAQDAFDLVANGETGPDVMEAIATWERKVGQMKASAELEWLARGILRVYKEQGIFFGDLHAGNLGKCKREGLMRWVITDPGHIVVVKRR